MALPLDIIPAKATASVAIAARCSFIGIILVSAIAHLRGVVQLPPVAHATERQLRHARRPGDRPGALPTRLSRAGKGCRTRRSSTRQCRRCRIHRCRFPCSAGGRGCGPRSQAHRKHSLSVPQHWRPPPEPGL
ncbi:hypothetical protein SMJ63A_50188 [Stenotrophomonas geniculata]